MKEYTTPDFAVRLCNADWLIENAKRVIVTLKNHVTLNLEGNRVYINDGVLYFSLTQGESAALGPGWVELEITITCTDGFTAKSPTQKIKLKQAVRRETA